jgi:hypothetical protein
MRVAIFFITFLFATNYGLNASACYSSWNGENTYVPFLGCVDEDGEDWGINWRNPYR